MVRIKYIVIAGLIAILGIVAVLYIFPSEQKRVKKQFDRLSEWASKEPDEKPLTMVQKVRSIGTLFVEQCELRAPVHSLEGSYTPEEISSYAAQARLQFSKISLRFYDLDIDFPEEGVARAMVAARLRGRWATGGYTDETRELECVLKKVGNKWLFSNVQVLEVLQR